MYSKQENNLHNFSLCQIILVSFSLIYPEYGMKVRVNFEISNNGYGRGTDQVEALTRYLPHKKVCNAGCHFHGQKGKGNILLFY